MYSIITGINDGIYCYRILNLLRLSLVAYSNTKLVYNVVTYSNIRPYSLIIPSTLEVLWFDINKVPIRVPQSSLWKRYFVSPSKRGLRSILKMTIIVIDCHCQNDNDNQNDNQMTNDNTIITNDCNAQTQLKVKVSKLFWPQLGSGFGAFRLDCHFTAAYFLCRHASMTYNSLLLINFSSAERSRTLDWPVLRYCKWCLSALDHHFSRSSI